MEDSTHYQIGSPSPMPQPSESTPRWVWAVLIAAVIAGAVFLVERYSRDQRGGETKEALNALPQESRDIILRRLIGGDDKAGRLEGERLLTEYPQDPTVIKTTAAFYYSSGANPFNRALLERSEQLFEQYLKQEPSDAAALHTLVRIKILLLKHKEGIMRVQDIVRQFPDRATAFYFDLGLLYDQSGNKQEAQRYYELILEIAPDYADAHIFLSRLAVGTIDTPTDIPRMRMHALKALELSVAPHQQKNRALASALLAESYLYEGEIAKALEHARRGVSLNPVCAGCVHVLGEVLIEKFRKSGKNPDKNDLGQGIASLQESIDLEPFLSHAYVSLGAGYWLNGDKDRARETWQKGLQILSADYNYPEWYKPVIKKELEEALANPEAFSL